MKKKFYYAAMFAAGLMTISTSCSNEDEIINEGENSEVTTGEQVIVLDMQDTDVLSTKSRPLYSTDSKGAELVTHVKLFIFEVTSTSAEGPMKLVNVIDIPNWNNSSTNYDYGRKYTYKLTGGDKLANDKTYTIIAVGQDEESAVPAPFKFSAKSLAELTFAASSADFNKNDEWAARTTPGEGFIKTDAVIYSLSDGACAYSNNTKVVSEIFSGTSDPVELSLDGGFQATVLLKRQVAGVIGYFNRIPAWVSVEDKHVSTAAIRLVSSARNTRVDLAIQLAKQKDDFENNAENIENIVNGFTASGDTNADDVKFESGENAYTVYQIDLTKWFKGGGNTDGSNRFWSDEALTTEATDNGCNLLNEDQWVNALKGTNNTPIVADGAVLAGEFVIPFDRVTGIEDNTFELQLLDSIGTVIKAWKVKLDDKSLNSELGDDSYVYNVYRNHLYQIGKRGSTDDPNNPGTDPDKPQPLDKDQELTIKINDQWEFIHDLEID